MKKHLLLFALLALAIQGCGDVCIGVWGSCVDDDVKSEHSSYPYREVSWGLRLQIGDYIILDSVFSDTNIVTEKLTEKVHNYKEARYLGRVYGWDWICAEMVSFSPSGGGSTGDSFYARVDPLGYFNFSGLFDKYPEGGRFFIRPRLIRINDARRLRCHDDNFNGLLYVDFKL